MNFLKIFFLSILVSTTLLNATSFSESKKLLLKRVYFDNQITFYCSNPYEIKQIEGREKALIIQDSKYYTPRNALTKKGKVNEKALTVDWEHIMPAENFGKHLSCWKDGGRKACKKDKTFNEMEADMHNLVPSISEVNGDRSNYRYGADIPTKGQYGNCLFNVDFKGKRTFVKEDIRGDIARIYFYMSDRYNIRLSNQEEKMFEVWNRQDPVSDWERTKNKRVEKIQGNSNPFIK